MNIKNINKKLFAVVLIILFLINSVLFLMPLRKTVAFYSADLSVILAAVLMLHSSMLAFDRRRDGNVAQSRFYGWPIMRVGISGLIASILINVILIVLIQFIYVLPWIVILLNLALLAAVGIGLIGADSSRNFVEEQRLRREVQTKTMKEMRLRSKQLVDICRTPELQSRLKNMANAFCYSDPNSSLASADIENQINAEIDLLEGTINTNVEQSYFYIDKIEGLLKKRNGIVLSGK